MGAKDRRFVREMQMKANKKKFIPREGLKRVREERGLSQAQLAARLKLGGAKTIRRWESGESRPYPYQRPQLAEILCITLEELNSLLANDPGHISQQQSQEQSSHRLWIKPNPQNPYFIGRDELLQTLHSAFLSGTGIQKQVLTGQPGIGKTQIAIEYAYRYEKDYQVILWVKAETMDMLFADIVHIASLLNLPEKDDPSKKYVIEQVKLWLEGNNDWLLVLDNIGDPNLLDSFLPQEGQGHLLLTARDPEVGTHTTTIVVKQLAKDDGVTLLLRRSKMIQEQGEISDAPKLVQEKAREIEQEMDGHPLALDQAGAYIAETTCTVQKYYELYQKHRNELLKKRGRRNFGYPLSLAATILLSFEQIERINKVAANLLRMSSFLHADDIPDEFFTTGDSTLSELAYPVAVNDFALTEARQTLGKYSFIHYRATEQTLSMHRLIQDVLKDDMIREDQLDWAYHTVWVVAFIVSRLKMGEWKQYQRYISHALACMAHIDDWQMYNESTTYLMIIVGAYLREIASYVLAERICQRSLELAQTILTPGHPFITMASHNLALLYEAWGRYEQAEDFSQQAIADCAKQPNPNMLTMANIMNSFARLCRLRGNYAEAETIAQQALRLRESLLEPNSPDVASSLNMLGEIYCIQRKWKNAEPLLLKALAIQKQSSKSNSPALALTLNSLVLLYIGQDQPQKAEPLAQQTLAIIEQERGPKHPETAKICNNLAEVYHRLGDLPKAEQYCMRALTIFEEVYGPQTLHSAHPLTVLAIISHKQGAYSKAEYLFKRALEITEEQLGPEHPDVISVLSGYVLLLREMERYDEADELDERVLVLKRLWLAEASPLEMLREEQAHMERKYLRKGGHLILNGVDITVEEYLARQKNDPTEK